ncbi:MAG: 3-phosphoserine/phosphohydroxythreonine transaminase [Bacteroidetes bacterium]|nr:3-phosphoserine/phosphohydroxythreonine transaminase [Bacteroidota bacterium]
MTKIHNFSAGPSILAESAFQKSIADIQNFAGTGLSILEISHRTKEFESIMDQARAIIKELLQIPENYDVLFLQGGASSQFFQIPHNFLINSAAYTKTGTWASGAIKEAKLYGEVNVVASSEDKNFNYIPKNYAIPETVDYFHCTSNNTIFGTQMKAFPKSPVPLFCDMSSDIFSRPVDVSQFSLIYAGAQKNMGPAGVTLVIIDKAMYDKRSSRPIPSMLDYKLHGEKESMYNTPPVFSILVSLYNLQWVKELGGVNAMAARNKAKSDLLYNAIDKSPYFKGTTARDDRSEMNACFVFEENDPELEAKFNAAWKEAGISGIKGHRSVGGYRASMYNALPLESVQALVNVIETFAL